MKKSQTTIDFFFGISFLLIFSLWFLNYGGTIYKNKTNEYLAGKEILAGITNHANTVCATFVNLTSYAPCPINRDANYLYTITTDSSNGLYYTSLKYGIRLNQITTCNNLINLTITNCSTTLCYYYDSGAARVRTKIGACN